jgi:NitT/TauT family transport system ATP-binding protein
MLLESHNLCKEIDQVRILDNISLRIEHGEFVSLIGPSGCGKTTLLRVLSSLSSYDSGTLDYSPETQAQLSCAVAFQDHSLYPWLTVLENIVLCLNDRDEPLKEKRAYARDFLKAVGLDPFINYYPGELSGGMLQRVNIVRAFSSSASLILMDEPFVYLDYLQRNALQKFTLQLLEKRNKTVFFITHNIHEAVTLSDRIYVMSALPGTIMKEYSVPFDRPRDVDAIRSKEGYQSLVNDLLRLVAR